LSAEEQDTLSEMTPLQQIHSRKSLSAVVPLPISTSTSSPVETSQTSATNNPTVRASAEVSNIANAADTKENIRPAHENEMLDDEDHLFDFDDAPRSTERPKFHLEEDESTHSSEAEDELTSLVTSPVIPGVNSMNLSNYATSPARTIMLPKTHPAYNPHNSRPMKSGSMGVDLTGTINEVGMGTSLSSSMRMNHPFSIPVVSPAVHELAKRLGPMNSFVGSFTGNSGLDESNGSFDGYGPSGSVMGGGNSFRGGSLRAGGAQPRSFSERMRLEDFMSHRTSGEGSDDGTL
jgi:hypothetical protein